jgi:Ca2+-binding RTX toxin-like protein
VLLPGIATAATTSTNPLDTWRLQRVDLPVTHATFLKSRNVVLATVNDNHAVFGNDMVELEPNTGAVVRHVYVGSQPNTFAVSDDDTVAYVGFQAATEIVKVNLLTFAVVDRFSTVVNPEYGAIPVVESLAVPPGHPETVVASLQIGLSPRAAGVRAFRDGVMLPDSVDRFTNELLYVNGVLYAAGNETSDAAFDTLAVDNTGVHLVNEAGRGIGRHMKLAGNGRIVTTGGQLIDPTGPTAVLRDFHQYGPVAPTPANDRVAFIGDPSGGAVGSNVSLYRMSTGSLIATRNFSVLWQAQDIIGTTAGYLVTMPQFVVDEGSSFYLLGPAVSAVSTTAPRPPLFIDALSYTTLPVQANRLEYDPSRLLLYAITTSGSPTAPDSLVALDPFTGDVRKQITIGANPSALAVSEDKTTAYVGGNSLHDVAVVDLATFSVTSRIALTALPDDYETDPPSTYDIKVRPGTNNTIAVSMADRAYARGLSIYTDGARTASDSTYPANPNSLAFAGASTLYASDDHSDSGELYRYTLDADGLHLVKTTKWSDVGLDFSITGDGRAWSPGGSVADPLHPSLLARLGPGYYGGSIVPMPVLGRVFKTDPFGLAEYSSDTYRLLGSIRAPLGFGGVDLVRTTLGFAATSTNGVLLFNPSLCHGLVPTIAGAGLIVGTPGDDVIVGSLGNDLIDGGGGSDVICALAGDDRLFGGAGDDDLDGGPGTDAVFLGADVVRHVVDLDNVADDGARFGNGRPDEADNVRSTNEIIVGSPGPDRIIGTGGRQVLRGGAGDDALYGGEGDDVLDGGPGNDVCGRALGTDLVNLCEVLR